jgi:hypothetical protein
MAQTTTNALMTIALAGMVADAFPNDFITAVAEESIPFGRVVEWDATGNKVRLPKSTTLGKIAGVAAYPVTKTPLLGDAGVTNPYGWAQYEDVRVLRKGRIWCETAGTAPVLGTAVNIMHASTGANAVDRGKVTSTATSAVAGSEITALAANVGFPVPANSTTPSGLALVEFNIP